MNHASAPDASLGQRKTIWRLLGVALAVFGLLVGAAVPATAAELMRVTFIRHGESAGNASGNIDTSTPGPVLTPKGQQQAVAVAGLLGDNNYDAIYASTMVRTQLTAAPMSQYLRLPIQVLPGLQEIEAGVFEGTPESQASSGYGLYPLAWAIQGNRDLRIPGSIDGNEFDARVDQALDTIYDNGDHNAVIFSHGGAIMFWTMMNAQNLTAAQKIDLLRTAPLSNTQYVVVEGNGDDGWTLVNWNGRLFAPEPTFVAEVRRQMRTLNRQLAASAQQFFDSLASRDFATIATALNRSITDAAFSIAKYHRAVRAKIIADLAEKATPAPAPAQLAVRESADVAAEAEPAAAQSAEPAAPKPAGRAVASEAEVREASDHDALTDVGRVTDAREPSTDDDADPPHDVSVDASEAAELRDDASTDGSVDTDASDTDKADSTRASTSDAGGNDRGADTGGGADTQRAAA